MLEMNIHDADYEFSHDEVMIDFYVKDSCHTNIQVSTAVSFPVVHANMLIRISWLHFGSKSQV